MKKIFLIFSAFATFDVFATSLQYYIQVNNQGLLNLDVGASYSLETKTLVDFAKDNYGNSVCGELTDTHNSNLKNDRYKIFSYGKDRERTRLRGNWIPHMSVGDKDYFRKDLLTGELQAINTNQVGEFIYARLQKTSSDGERFFLISTPELDWVVPNLPPNREGCDSGDDDSRPCPYIVSFNNGKKEIKRIYLPKNTDNFYQISGSLEWAVVSIRSWEEGQDFNLLLVNVLTKKHIKLDNDYRYSSCSESQNMTIFEGKDFINVVCRENHYNSLRMSERIINLKDNSITRFDYDPKIENYTYDDINYHRILSFKISALGRLETAYVMLGLNESDEKTYSYDFNSQTSKLIFDQNNYVRSPLEARAQLVSFSPNLRFGLFEISKKEAGGNENWQVWPMKYAVLKDFSTGKETNIPLDVLTKCEN